MQRIKLTKSSLRDQQHKLEQLEKYLPTLRLKKALLQIQVNATSVEIVNQQKELEGQQVTINKFSSLLVNQKYYDPFYFAEVRHLEKSYENVAGVELPHFENIVFQEANYLLFDTPPWFDTAVVQLRKLVNIRENIHVLEEKKRALKKELRDVTIRVNLFEKMLIPQTGGNIKKIKIFLEDQQLAAVSQAKVAKTKILALKGSL